MNDNILARIADLRDDIDRSAQTFTDAAPQPATASDGSGAISVTLAGDGSLTDVQVDATSFRSLDPRAVGAAVLEAMANAALSQIEGWATATAAKVDEPAAATRPLPMGDSSLSGELTSIAQSAHARGTDHGLEQLVVMLRAVNDSMDQLTENLQAQVRATHEGRNASGDVVATVNGTRTLTDIHVDEQWAGAASAADVGRGVLEAVRAAYSRAGERSAADVVADSPLGALQALADDPAALAAMLGLR